MITPTFHFRILNDFLQVFEEQAAILVTRLEVIKIYIFSNLPEGLTEFNISTWCMRENLQYALF